MANFATTDDLAAFWRPLSTNPDEETKADALIGYAAELIRDEWPGIDDRIGTGDGKIRPAVVRFVVLSMVKRAMLAGDQEGVKSRQVMEVEGPWTHQQLDTLENPTGSLYLTDNERRRLSPAGSRGSGGAFTVSMMPPDVSLASWPAWAAQ